VRGWGENGVNMRSCLLTTGGATSYGRSEVVRSADRGGAEKRSRALDRGARY